MQKVLFLVKNFVIVPKSKHTISLLFSVILSIIPLILVLQISDRMILGITKRFIETFSYHLQINLEDTQYKNAKKILASFSPPNLTHRYIEKREYGVIGKTGNAVSYVRGFDKAPDKSFLDMFVIRGKFDISKNNIVLGDQIAKKINAKIGDKVNLLSIVSRPPKIIKLNVSAIVKTGYMELDKTWSFLSIKNLNRISKNQNFILGFKIKDPFILPNMIESSKIDYDFYYKNVLNKSKYLVQTWFEKDEDRYSSFVDTKKLIEVILFLIILVSVISTTSSFILLITEKELEICYLRCLGISKLDVFFSFLLSIFIISITGVFIGDCLSCLIFKNINSVLSFISQISLGKFNILSSGVYLEKVPSDINFKSMIFYSLMFILISSFLGIIPALKSLKIAPIELIKKI